MEEIDKLFALFMEWVVYLDGLHRLSAEILQEFVKLLESYCRTQGDLADVRVGVVPLGYLGPLDWENSPRSRGDIEQDISRTLAENSAKLESAIKRLWVHLNEAQVCLGHLVDISKDVSKLQSEMEITRQLERFNLSTRESVDERGFKAEQSGSNEEHQNQLSFSDYSSMMASIYKMVEEDYNMQRKIVEALGLWTPSEALETYCSMWTMQPCIDSKVIDRARSWIRNQY